MTNKHQLKNTEFLKDVKTRVKSARSSAEPSSNDENYETS